MFHSYFHYNQVFFVRDLANPGCCRSNTHMVGAEGQGPIMGIPLGSSEGCSRLGGCAQCSSQHGTAGHSSAAAPDALRSGSPSSAPCVREGGLGEGKRFQLLSQRPQWSSTGCCISPRSCGTCPGLLPWITKGHQSAFHHLSSTFPILKSTRLIAG